MTTTTTTPERDPETLTTGAEINARAERLLAMPRVCQRLNQRLARVEARVGGNLTYRDAREALERLTGRPMPADLQYPHALTHCLATWGVTATAEAIIAAREAD